MSHEPLTTDTPVNPPTKSPKPPPVTNPDNLPLVLGKSHLAVLLNRSPRTIERWYRARRLPDPLPLPGSPGWSRGVVLDWMDGRTRRRR